MSPSPQLSDPGSSSYDSPTMTVGDGTWDSESNTFLLPNLQGLNFNTMRYNGMGNRFANMPGYFNLIQAHGILAAITFLFVVPFAIIFFRYYGRNPRLALRLHIWCQILTVLLTTALFILGYMAVGTRRSLTNPHHGIGVALYTLVLVQFIGGWWVHKRESKKRLPYAPLRVVLHHWIGRVIGLLGLVQVPLGLTLYGAPSYLFILYSIMGFLLVLIYFVLSYMDGRNQGRDINSDYSWASDSGGGGHGRFGRFAKVAVAGVGIGALAHRLRNRDEAVASRRHSGSYLDDEKYSQYGRDSHRKEGWKGKFLGLGVIATLGYWFGKLLGRREDRMHQGSDDVTESSGDSLERIEEGRPAAAVAAAGRQPLNPALSHQRSRSSMSEDSFISGSPSRQRRHTGVRDAAIGLGTFAFARKFIKSRRDRKEQRRIDELREQELRDERVQRANSRRYTGDGYPRRGGRHGSMASNDLTPLPEGGAGSMGAGLLGAATGAATASAIDRNRTAHPGPSTTNVPPPAGPSLPPPPPLHNLQGAHNSSGSEIYASSGGRKHHRHHVGADAAAAGLAGGAAGLAAGEALARRRERSESRRQSTGTGSMASPPVSVKLNMHSDGRHVTLRRLTEEEAATERARNRSRRRRAGSTGSFSGTDTGMGGERWRRTEAREQQEQEAMERQRLQASQAQLNSGNAAPSYPPPPPIPVSDPRRTDPGSVGSPGTHDGNATETSTNYADNRRRRRAERAAATAAAREREGRGSFD